MAKFKIHNEKYLSVSEQLLKLQESAKMYSVYANKNLMFVYRGNKYSGYEYYEVYFGEENFMHLTGCKGNGISAVEFYSKCLNGTISKQEYLYQKDIRTASMKLSVLPYMLDFKHSKVYKIGDKDLITEHNQFEMATGNMKGILGYDSRRGKSAHSIPVTVMKKPLADYVSKPNAIVLLLVKGIRDKYYNKLVYSIKENLIKDDILPEYIKSKIKEKLLN